MEGGENLNSPGYIIHEMGHRTIGVTWGIPPTGLFSGIGYDYTEYGQNSLHENYNINSLSHELYPDGWFDCRYSMMAGHCANFTMTIDNVVVDLRRASGIGGYSPSNEAYMLHRLLVNRKIDLYHKLPIPEPICDFFPGADMPNIVTQTTRRARNCSTDFSQQFPPLICAPGLLDTYNDPTCQ
jgi:hypothetical protein